MPLFYVAGHGAWLIAAALAQALLGAVCVWGMRSLLGSAVLCLPAALDPLV
ncbi:MAG: hypothetical protein Q8K96_11125 [Rubrivivax sp.]|nr:hypothetical protein [Rubrivivax sp.]